MLISRRKAIAIFHKATGRSVNYSRTAINKMPKETDGKREKINTWRLDRLISKTNQAPAIQATRTIRPISDRRAQQIRERCI